MKPIYFDSIVQDTDPNVIYWIGWQAQDQTDGATFIEPDKFRVFRDRQWVKHAEPITEAVSREEALVLLKQLQLLIHGA